VKTVKPERRECRARQSSKLIGDKTNAVCAPHAQSAEGQREAQGSAITRPHSSVVKGFGSSDAPPMMPYLGDDQFYFVSIRG